MNKNIFVVQPLLPNLEKFKNLLTDIWKRKYITNNGYYHQLFEQKLCQYLDVKYISLYTNGTIPLLASLKFFNLKGNIITTPYTFVATSNSIIWSNLTPKFVDVDEYGNIDPLDVQKNIDQNTSAILAVHVYGNSCQTQQLKQISNKYNLKLIYDASHAFGVKKNNKSLLLEGDLSTISFHATKTFNTIQGGAIICHTAEQKNKLDKLKNFGFDNQFAVSQFGINGKLDQIRSAYGLLNLQQIDQAIQKRKIISNFYIKELNNIKGINFFEPQQNINYNYSYFPIFITEEYKLTRDELYLKLKDKNIYARKYFYPLVTDFKVYNEYKKDFKNAKTLSDQVLCLPIHTNLNKNDVERIINEI